VHADIFKDVGQNSSLASEILSGTVIAEHFFLFWCSIMCLVESSCYTHVSHHSSFSYLHSCEPPIIHGNLTCDTIFIQHNGLIKIGSGGLKHSDFLNVIDFIIFADFFFLFFCSGPRYH